MSRPAGDLAPCGKGLEIPHSGNTNATFMPPGISACAQLTRAAVIAATLHWLAVGQIFSSSALLPFEFWPLLRRLPLTHWATHFHVSFTSLMDCIKFYRPPLGSSRAASRFPACREAAIAPQCIPRSGITPGGKQRGHAKELRVSIILFHQECFHFSSSPACLSEMSKGTG